MQVWVGVERRMQLSTAKWFGAAETVVGLSLPESELDAVLLDAMGRCFWASVDEVERPVRQ